ncbi:hypothetical protein CRI93_05175 [Longimonas halophila]|uniref:DUF2946 domain-containing protein n=1 Tax=Longimonas halophila TaxID=1469170 RepID=A0A2H3P9A5_9BACT|nr:hypothetical protein [Longimonas halophila]PEN08501.1 hypothetical protein CRI93_05175 [Longimonas halophila]
MVTSRHIAAAALLALFVMGGIIAPSVHAAHHASAGSHQGHHGVPQCEAVPARWTTDTSHADVDCTLCSAVVHAVPPLRSPVVHAYGVRLVTVPVQPTSGSHSAVLPPPTRGPPHARAHA